MSTTLEEAREWLRERVDKGAKCPCCTQLAKVYKRSVHASMARALILMYRAGGALDFVHAPTVTRRDSNTETGKLAYWGLLVEADAEREDGGRAGFYKVTQLGVDFVEGRATIPKYAHTYDGRCLGFSGAQVTIYDALGKRFDYRALMAGEG
jgi:hypothetical protein